MSDSERLPVVLCWHMHQPSYLDRETGQYHLPWTYLHAIKDYVDMAAILEQVPQARAVINFAPTLLEQIDDYAVQVRGYLNDNRPIGDALLAALVMPTLPTDEEHRLTLIKSCLRANRKRLIDRFPRFRMLADLATCIDDHIPAVRYFDDPFLVDLLVWYHLAWLGETVRRSDDRVRGLVEKGEGFSYHDRRLLLEVIAELLEGVIPRYRRLAEQGTIELSVTPYAHPIVPLLLDLATARDAVPDMALPVATHYPGGESRAHWHVEEGLRVFERYFGSRPVGCWPSEGSISKDTLRLLETHGFKWAASGGSVLRNSLHRSGMESGCIHRAYHLPNQKLVSFFRDDGLSDLIGFSYSDWHADDAVNNLMHHLENIEQACLGSPGRMVAIILDGENAWEYYPENGYHFLAALYGRLSEHPKLRLSTFNEFLSKAPPVATLSELVAGSWVYGTFSTWIGDPDKNRGWDLLVEAKNAFDHVMDAGTLSAEQQARAERQLAICEGSDWFWWFGDYNPSESVRDFERLFRMHLAELYRLIGVEPPDSLSHAISHGSGSPQLGGVMRRGQEG